MHIKRFYRKQLPENDDIVIVKIKNENEYGYACDLLEYDGIEGFIPLRESVNTRYIKKHALRLNDTLPTIVLNVDPERKIVEVSRKRIKDETETDALSNYKVCSNINRLLNECYIMHLNYNPIEQIPIDDLMHHTVWKLYENTEENNSNALYKNILNDLSLILPNELFADDFIQKAKGHMEDRIIKNNTIVEMNFMLLIIEENALLKIKEALNVSDMHFNDYKITITIISPPHYKIKIEGAQESIVMEMMLSIKKMITDRVREFYHMLNFEDFKITSETSYQIKFLANVDLERLNFA